MLLTRLHRSRDYMPFITGGATDTLPNTVGGMLWLTIKGSPFRWFMILVSSSAWQALYLAVPYSVKLIIDGMATAPEGLESRLEYIWPAFTVLIIVVVLRFFVQYCTWTISYFWRPARRRMSHAIGSYVLGHTPHFFESDLSGRIIQKSITLYSSIEAILNAIMWNWISTSVFFIVAVIMLAAVNPMLAVIALAWFILMFTTSRWVGREISSNARVTSEAKSQMIGYLADAIINIRNVLQYSHQKLEISELARKENTIIDKEQYWYLSILNVRLFNQLMSLIALLGIIGASIYLWAEGMATVGDISLASTLIILVVTRAIELAENLPDTLDHFGNAQDSLDTLVKPRDLTDAPDARPLHTKGGAIDFNAVNFVYPGAGATVFHDFNMHIRPGERVGLVGVSGAGKSTLVSLLLRMYDVEGGSITIDDQDISQVTQKSLRQSISFIPQDTMLFHRTVRENIAYGKLDATDEEIMAAAKAAQAHDFIMRMPHGYNTMVGERGVKLSGGQRQRIAIARALLKNAPILILDEATSALDSEAEHEIQAAINTAMQGKTVIAIAHRLSTIASLDRLIVLDNGRIIEEGTHSQLIAKGGIYAALWQHQSGGFLGLD